MFAQHPARCLVLGVAATLVFASPASASQSPTVAGPNGVSEAAAPAKSAKLKPKPPARSRHANGKKQPPTPEQLASASIAAAADERAGITARAAEIAGRHDPAASARWLSVQAQATLDPFVFLMAAETLLDAATSDEQLVRVLSMAEDAVLLAEAPTVLRIDPEQISQVRSRRDAIRSAVAERRATRQRDEARRKLARRGKLRVAAGGALLSLGAAGLGLIAGGAVQQGRYHDARESTRGMEQLFDATAWEAYYDQGSRMLVAGTIVTIVGITAGVPLVVLGVRDRRSAHEAADKLTVGLRPGLGSIGLLARF